MVSKLPLLAFLVTVFVSQLCLFLAVNADIYFGLFPPLKKYEEGYNIRLLECYEKCNKTIILMWPVGSKGDKNRNQM